MWRFSQSKGKGSFDEAWALTTRRADDIHSTAQCTPYSNVVLTVKQARH